MVDYTYRDHFLNAAESWLCDSYSVDVRYIAGNNGNELTIWEVFISMFPIPIVEDMSFNIQTDYFCAGQFQADGQSKQRLLEILNKASQGSVEVNGMSLTLGGDEPEYFFSDMVEKDRWFSDLHLQVGGKQIPSQTALNINVIDNALRQNELPFDGLADITGWLGLKNSSFGQSRPIINIRIAPPVDIMIAESRLADDQLCLTLHSHPKFDVDRIKLAVRALPGKALAARKQAGAEIQWSAICDGRREGIVNLHIEHADSALAMLMLGDATVRRHWFIDSAKARNLRLVAVLNFDKDLYMIRQAVLEAAGSRDSDRFEKGIAALLFLQGFAPALQIETDAPDILVTTPNGRLIVVECTTRMADFNAKLGKLVDRKGALSKALQASNHHSRVEAILVCALPKNQIATDASELKKHQVVLITRDELNTIFDELRFPIDPDAILEKTVSQLSRGIYPFVSN